MTPVDTLLQKIADQIINPIIGLMFAVAILVFLYGMVEFVAGAGNEDKRTQGKRHIIWGIIGLFIMVSVFGLMQVLCNFFYNGGCY